MPVPFASQGDKNTIPVTPSTETGQTNYASYQKGFPPVTMTPLVAGGLPPQGMDMNGILFALSSSIGFSQSGGLPTFNADFASTIGGYPLGAVLQSNDGASAYVSTIANNTTDFNESPESIGTSWLPWAGDAAKGSSLYIAVGEGTSDAITATFDPAITELTNGLVVFVRALASNATTTPTFNPDGLGAATITKGTYQPLAVGDIAGNGYWMILQYDSTQGKWVLQNPAKGIDVSTGVPVGTVVMFTAAEPPAGYLKCDGSAVGRTTYPELYAAIGTTYGAGDGSTTFNLPDLIGRFAEGSATPGTVKEAGLPNITGSSGAPYYTALSISDFGAFYAEGDYSVPISNNGSTQLSNVRFDASRSNSIYGKSDTVQPPALTLLPCIKAFDASVNPGLIDITELANDVAGKADISLSNLNAAGKSVAASLAMPSSRYIDLTFGASGTTYTAPADGWVFLWRICSGQGGIAGLYGRVVSIFSGDANEEFCIYIPVAKGEVFNIYYAELKTGQSTDYFRFFYANGSQS